MVTSGFRPNQHWIWYDGCSSQFKSKVPWYFVSQYLHITSGCICMWSLFGFGHGKGLYNRASVVLKCFIWQAQLNVESPELPNEEQVVSLLKEKLSGRPESLYSSGSRRFVTCIFFHVKPIGVDRVTQYTCDTIKGTRDLHS